MKTVKIENFSTELMCNGDMFETCKLNNMKWDHTCPECGFKEEQSAFVMGKSGIYICEKCGKLSAYSMYMDGTVDIMKIEKCR